MISVTEAIEIISKNSNHFKITSINIKDALGYILAENIYAPHNSPHFNQSAMDGYAFAFDNCNLAKSLPVIGEVQTGNCFKGNINSQEAIRIFTGAALPHNTDTVVMQEHVVNNNHCITINNANLIKGTNVRTIGSQTKQGELIAEKLDTLTPAAIAFIAGFGITNIKVFATPAISIITTGKELLQPNEKLSVGKIFESNSYALIAALKQMNITPLSSEIVDDDEPKIIETIKKNIHADMVILTGGVSVGDYDFVSSALEKCGVKKLFHKVKQKPGKPLYFGKINNTLVFGLPGNPASVLTCFYMYVAHAINCFSHQQYFKNIILPLANSYSKKAGLTFFLKGKVMDNMVYILDSQKSYKMNSFAKSNCIIELNEDREFFEKNEMVRVKLLL